MSDNSNTFGEIGEEAEGIANKAFEHSGLDGIHKEVHEALDDAMHAFKLVLNNPSEINMTKSSKGR